MSDPIRHPHTTPQSGAHLDDARLVALMDGELGSTDRETGRRHLAECAPCSARMNQLCAVSEVLSEAQRSIQIPPRLLQAPRRRATDADGPRRLRAWDSISLPRIAAVALVAAGIAAAASQPVRAAVLRLTHAILGRSNPDTLVPRSTAMPPAAGSSERPRDASVSFNPVSSEITLEFDVPWAARALVFVRGTADSAVVIAVRAHQRVPDLVMLPAGARIRNASTPDAEYRVELPRAVGTVVVRARDAVIATLVASRLPLNRDSVIDAGPATGESSGRRSGRE